MFLDCFSIPNLKICCWQYCNSENRKEFSNSNDISYIVFESSSEQSTGYTKIYQNGKCRVAVPAFSGYNSGDISIPHIASDSQWWTGISLVNTTLLAKKLTIEFSNGDQKQIELSANEQEYFAISELFDQKSQPEIKSGIIKNGDGIVGLELFGSVENSNELSGILLKDDATQKIYFPHVDQSDNWWTGIALYNPSALAADTTITPYNEDGTPLSASIQNIKIAGHENIIKNIKEFQLPETTAWLKIEATNPITGFELFGTSDHNCLAGYTGVNISKREGIFAKLEKKGWTGIAFVNTENQLATINLKAYNDAGKIVATEEIKLSKHAKRVDIAENIFDQDISPATYIKYSSDTEIVGFQLNGSSDDMMLDGLPGL